MIGLPNQKIEDIDEMLKLIDNIQPTHVSVYSLTVEDDTKLCKKINDGRIFLPNEIVERQMYWKVKKELNKLGFEHYEISNFARRGFYSKHNINCWNQKEYIGFGASAHSYTDNVRYSNIADIDKYISNYKNNKSEDNFVFHEKQNLDSKMREYMILGLRKIKGVELNEFENIFGISIKEKFSSEMKKLLEKGLIDINEYSIYLTDKGIDLANIVWTEFI